MLDDQYGFEKLPLWLEPVLLDLGKSIWELESKLHSIENRLNQLEKQATANSVRYWEDGEGYGEPI